MLPASKVIFIVLILVAVTVLSISLLKSLMGRPTRGTLQVPQGKSRVRVDVFDDSPLRPFKFGQVFETLLVPAEQTMVSTYSGEARTSKAQLLFRNKPIGFADSSSSHVEALLQLAERYPKVTVPTVVASIDAEGRPLVELVLPDAKWFQRAAAAGKRERSIDW